MNKKQNTWLLACSLLAIAMTLSGCGNKQKHKFHFDYLAVQMSKGDSWSIIDKDGKVIVKEEYPADARLSSISSEGVYWVNQDGKYQLFSIDDPKKPVIDEDFTCATAFYAGVAAVSNPNEQIRILDTNGQTIATLPKNIKRCNEFNLYGYATYEDFEGKKGVIDKKGNIVIKADYNELVLSEEIAYAIKDNYDIGNILDIKGKKLCEIDHNKYHILCTDIREGKILVRHAGDDEGHTIVLDLTGQKLFEIKKAMSKYSSYPYVDGYLVFRNGDDKWGVADDKGEIVIRPKYEDMTNLTDGLFWARKDKKWGIVNEKDETVIGFDYDNICALMGNNFILMDGNSWALIGKDDKEITSFDDLSIQSSYFAEFVDVSSITNALVKFLTEMEQLQTADVFAKEKKLDIDKFHYSSSISHELNIDDKVLSDITISFDGYIAEEKSHQEQVDDGWFTYNRTVSDGWVWNKELPRRVSGNLRIKDSAISGSVLYNSICQQLANGRKIISDGTFSKNVKIAGKTIECRISLSQDDQSIDMEITFNK